jgi:FixJ family two-component response regulator
MQGDSLMQMLTNAAVAKRQAKSVRAAAQSEVHRPLVLVVDDDEEIRLALRELFESVGLDALCFGSPRELLEAELPNRPGCLVLDIRMPGPSGLDLHQQLARQGDARPVIFLTGHGDIPMTVQAMKAGAVDFLTKPVRDQALLDAVTTAIERDVALQASARLVKRQVERFAMLTPRERQVMREVAHGRLNKQIAFDLGISVVTVKLHRGNAMRKMEARSIGELVRAWEVLPPAVRQEFQPGPKHSIRRPRNERDVGLGLPGHISEAHPIVQSGVGGDCR